MYNPLKWSASFLQALWSAGSRHIFISPGSRSTPLTLAAAFHPGFKKSIILDERSAAFAALGASRHSGKPSLLICTSGTAAANYYPAVIEAKASGVPLIVLTADRPPVSRQIGSSQTIDQIKLYGDHAVFFHEAGEPADDPTGYHRLAYLAGQAFRKSTESGGAAHINFPFRKPLEPDEEQILEMKEFYYNSRDRQSVRTAAQSRTIRVHPEVARQISLAKRPLIIGGVTTPAGNLSASGLAFADSLRAPVIAEPGSWYSAYPGRIFRFDQILRNLHEELIPDLIIRTGDQPFTKSLIDFFHKLPEIPVIHLASRNSEQDEALRVTAQILIQKSDTLELPLLEKKPEQWLKRWLEADRNADAALSHLLSETKSFTDGHAIRIFASEARGFHQMISNSFTPRDLALFGESYGKNHLNRGAAGIDGILSAAAGIASVAEAGEKVYCLAGDLAFLHDSNALYTIKKLDTPLITVIINNSGGAIFRMLPVWKTLNRTMGDDLFRTYFETPHQISFQKLSEAAGLDYYRAATAEELRAIGLRGLTGPAVVECVTGPDQSMEMRQQLWRS